MWTLSTKYPANRWRWEIIDGRIPEINVEVMLYFSEGEGFSNAATARCQQALDETIGVLLGKVSEKMGNKKDIKWDWERTYWKLWINRIFIRYFN